MADILELRGKLKSVAEQEKKIFQAEEPRQFFIELFPAGSVEELIKEFEPDTHNSKAQAEFQKLKKSTADIDKYIKNRRAVAYMFSGKQCVKKHYEETELTCHVMGVARMNWVLNELEQLQRTQIEGQPIFTAKKG
jgi:hypothetical protein